MDYQEGEHYCYSLGFFNGDMSDLEKLLVDLNKQQTIPTVAKYYFEQTGEDLFFVLINGKLEEFETFGDALNAISMRPEAAGSLDVVIDYDPKRTSLVNLYLKKAKRKKVLDYINAIANSETDSFEDAWDGAIEPMLSLADSVVDKGSNFVISINIFERELFPGFPNDEEIQNAIIENEEENKGIIEQQTKDLSKLGFSGDELKEMLWTLSTDKDGCREELIAQRLNESAEAFLNNLLKLDGISKGHMVFRTHLVDDGEEISSTGTHSDGVYICSVEELSDTSSWVK